MDTNIDPPKRIVLNLGTGIPQISSKTALHGSPEDAADQAASALQAEAVRAAIKRIRFIGQFPKLGLGFKGLGFKGLECRGRPPKMSAVIESTTQRGPRFRENIPVLSPVVRVWDSGCYVGIHYVEQKID